MGDKIKPQVIIKEATEEKITIGDDDLDKQFAKAFVLIDNKELRIVERPEFVNHPKLGGKVRITDMRIAEQDIYCPKCGNKDKHGIICLENGIVLFACKACREYISCRFKED